MNDYKYNQRCIVCDKTYREHSEAHGDQCLLEFWNGERAFGYWQRRPDLTIHTRHGIFREDGR